MNISTDWLISKILDFLTVLYKCFSETTYAQDRSLYANDIATAVGWLVRLHQGAIADEVARDIVNSSTTKHFTDYWKQGSWGDLEAQAVKELQEAIRKVVTP